MLIYDTGATHIVDKLTDELLAAADSSRQQRLRHTARHQEHGLKDVAGRRRGSLPYGAHIFA